MGKGHISQEKGILIQKIKISSQGVPGHLQVPRVWGQMATSIKLTSLAINQ